MLSGLYGSASPGDRIQLQALWDLLAGRPNFEPGWMVAPLCRIKSWEDRLAMSIVLPRDLAGLSAGDRELAAARCTLDPGELTGVFETVADTQTPMSTPIASRETPVSGRRLSSTVAPVPSPSFADRSRSAPSRRKRPWVVIGVLSLLLPIVAAVLTFSGDGVDRVQPSVLGDGLPLIEVTRQGDNMIAVLRDATWVLQATNERRVKLEEAFRRAEALGVSALLVLGPARDTVAMVSGSSGGKVMVLLSEPSSVAAGADR